MRRTDLTGSKVGLAEECPGAFAYPAFPGWHGPAAERGSAIHRFIHVSIIRGRGAALKDVPAEYLDICQRINVQGLVAFLGGQPQAEVALAWNALTDKGARLQVVRERGYDVVPGAGWIPGTADAVRVVVSHELRTVTIYEADWKTGQYVAHPSRNRQIQTYALALARMAADKLPGYRVTVEAMIVYIDEEGDPSVHKATFGAMELDAMAAEIKAVYEAVQHARDQKDQGQDADVSPGLWCRWCDAFPSCPAQAGRATALVDLATRPVRDLSPERAGEAWELLSVVKHAVTVMEEALKGMAERSPLPLADGGTVRPVPRKVTELNQRLVKEVLQELGLLHLWDRTAKVTQKGLLKVLPPDKAEHVFQVFQERQAMVVNRSFTVRKVSKNWKPKP